PPARDARDVVPEEANRSTVGTQLPRDEVEERGLAGAVRTDDEPALARLDGEADRGRHAKPPEGLVEAAHGERAHRPASCRGGIAAAAACGRHLAVDRRTRRPRPGTSPSGMNTTMRTKMAPRTKFQRSM